MLRQLPLRQEPNDRDAFIGLRPASMRSALLICCSESTRLLESTLMKPDDVGNRTQ